MGASCEAARRRFVRALLSIRVTVLLDTDVVVAALRSEGEASRQVRRRVLEGRHVPVFGNALWLEYEDLLGRPVWTDPTTVDERLQILGALARAGRWVTLYYGWRPNLPDEADNHLIELAFAAGAQAIVTHNIRDVGRGELRWQTLEVLTPAQFLERYP